MTHKTHQNYFCNRAILYKKNPFSLSWGSAVPPDPSLSSVEATELTYSLMAKFGICCPEYICHKTDISISASPK